MEISVKYLGDFSCLLGTFFSWRLMDLVRVIYLIVRFGIWKFYRLLGGRWLWTLTQVLFFMLALCQLSVNINLDLKYMMWNSKSAAYDDAMVPGQKEKLWISTFSGFTFGSLWNTSDFLICLCGLNIREPLVSFDLFHLDTHCLLRKVRPLALISFFSDSKSLAGNIMSYTLYLRVILPLMNIVSI